jgi:hypothetical protein
MSSSHPPKAFQNNIFKSLYLLLLNALAISLIFNFTNTTLKSLITLRRVVKMISKRFTAEMPYYRKFRAQQMDNGLEFITMMPYCIKRIEK